MAEKKAVFAPYTDMAKPNDANAEAFEEAADKAALSSDSKKATYEDNKIPGAGAHVIQKRGEI